MNLSVDFAGVKMKNPVTTASGTFGSGEEFSEYVDLNRLGAVTDKRMLQMFRGREMYAESMRDIRMNVKCDRT